MEFIDVGGPAGNDDEVIHIQDDSDRDEPVVAEMEEVGVGGPGGIEDNVPVVINDDPADSHCLTVTRQHVYHCDQPVAEIEDIGSGPGGNEDNDDIVIVHDE